MNEQNQAITVANPTAGQPTIVSVDAEAVEKARTAVAFLDELAEHAIEQATNDLVCEVRERDDLTLAEANRIVSRSLYRASRDLGWRKLTARERVKHGLGVDHPQWVRESHLAQVSPIYAGRATGVGDWTDTAARMSPEVMVVRREYLDA